MERLNSPSRLTCRRDIFGTGRGSSTWGARRYAIWLAEHGHTVSLVDLSPELVASARTRVQEAGIAGRVTEIVAADACDLSQWGTGTFDAALSLGPFYHLPDDRDRVAATRELARVVRLGGHVFVAAMPSLAFLGRTLILPDERHHILDAAWMRRLLDDGVVENEVAGRFNLGYGVSPGEIEGLFETHGFVTGKRARRSRKRSWRRSPPPNRSTHSGEYGVLGRKPGGAALSAVLTPARGERRPPTHQRPRWVW